MKINRDENGRGRGGIRLLFVSDHLGHAGGLVHGVTTYYLNVLPRLREAGVEVTPCFLRARHPMAAKLEAAGVSPLFLDRGKWDLRALSDLHRLIGEKGIQIIHVSGMKSILLGRAVARFSGRPVIIHLHDMFAPGPLLGALHRSMAGWTDLCLVVSNAARGLASREFGIPGERVSTLYNGLPRPVAAGGSEARSRVRREFGFPSAASVLGVVGRLSAEKGQLSFLRALPQLLATHPQTRVLIVGNGPLRQKCEELSKSLGLTSVVRFTGHRDDVPELLAAIDVLAIPSLSEGLPYIAIEAMMAGRPIAAFGVGGIPELISDGPTGLLVPPNDMGGLLAAIRRLLDDGDLGRKLGDQGRIQVKKFSLEKHVEELLAHYRRLSVAAARGLVGDVAKDSQ